MSTPSSNEIARLLLKERAVTLRPSKPFVWASGIKSPIYCDNRLLLSDPRARTIVVKAFEKLIRQKKIRFDALAGIATAGIPWAAILADRLKKPMVYVRSSPKGHGKGNQIEGMLKKGWRVLVVEDLVSTGESSLNAVKTLKKAGAKVKDCFAIFTYGFLSAKKSFQRSGCRLQTLTDLRSLLKIAPNNLIEGFSRNPRRWIRVS